jgi:hypothetical protein
MIFKNKILSIVVGVVLIVVIVPAGAMAANLTSGQVQSIVLLLRSFGVDSATVTSVQNALNGGTQTQTLSAWCHTFSNNLGVGNKTCAGDSNIETASLEVALVREGLLIQHNGDCVSFDEKIASAVVKFQARYGILQTGYVGPLTRAKLNTLYGCKVVCPQLSPPSPDWCKGGTITQGVMGDDGCYGPPGCSLPEKPQCITNVDCPSVCTACTKYPYNSCVDSCTDYTCVNGKCVASISGCSNLYWLDNINKDCLSQKVFCGAYMYFGLQTFVNQQDCLNVVVQPSITITSPNGGEQWKQGSTHEIKWTYIGLADSTTVTILLKNLSNNSNYQLGTYYAKTGSLTWTVPGSILPGTTYKIYIFSGNTANDLSDNYFTIVAY